MACGHRALSEGDAASAEASGQCCISAELPSLSTQSAILQYQQNCSQAHFEPDHTANCLRKLCPEQSFGYVRQLCRSDNPHLN